MRIGILSDTHSYLHPKMFDFFRDCDEIWHAGDIGSAGVLDTLTVFKPLRAVYGNIDDAPLRAILPEHLIFTCEEMKVFLVHIAGYPGHYNVNARKIIENERPDLVVTGHSHILKVLFDHKYNHLHINPGAAGRYGLHKSITLIRLEIVKSEAKNMEVLDIERNGI
ncbi:MAG: metallophosphoesterase family protein [Bacteroidales bacterium]|nr:metallophosphoesterase family protein [Bacteroidales bacterium]